MIKKMNKQVNKMQIEQLTGGSYYHIYNRGNNRSNLFSMPADYEHFLRLYDKYISPVAETLAWVLMPNHVHMLVRIRENMVYKYSPETPIDNRLVDAIGWEKWFEEHKWETVDADLPASLRPDNVGPGMENTNGDFNAVKACPDYSGSNDVDRLKLKIPIPYRHFSHLFNAYARYCHNRTGGSGNLFERPFKRKKIDNDSYLKQVILYVHNNPVHHGFCTHPLEYSWSSYITCISDKPTKLKREAVVKLFGDNQKFETEHLEPVKREQMDKWLDVNIDYQTDIKNLIAPDLSAYAEPDNVKIDGMKTTYAEPDNVKVDGMKRTFEAPDNVKVDGMKRTYAVPARLPHSEVPDNVGLEGLNAEGACPDLSGGQG
jgi:REP element-mobilizing transposase RayT